MSELQFFRSLPMWECPSCGYIFKDNQRLTCIQCGVKRAPPKRLTIENYVLRYFCKIVGINYDALVLKTHKERSEYAHNLLAPKLDIKQRELLFRFFTIIFESIFATEDDTFTVEWTGKSTSAGCTATVVATDPRCGSKHANFTTDGGAFESSYCYKNFSGEPEAYARIYIKFLTALPAEGKVYNILGLYAGAQRIGTVIIKTSGTTRWQLYWRDGAGNNWSGLFAPVISLNVWYCVELRVVISNAAGIVTFYINDVEKLSKPGLDTDNTGNLTQIRTGEILSDGTTAHTIYVDCVIVADQRITCQLEVPSLIPWLRLKGRGGEARSRICFRRSLKDRVGG